VLDADGISDPSPAGPARAIALTQAARWGKLSIRAGAESALLHPLALADRTFRLISSYRPGQPAVVWAASRRAAGTESPPPPTWRARAFPEQVVDSSRLLSA